MESGIDRIAKGECPINGNSPMACMFCNFGHMTECHYPMTCQEANCSHYREQNADEEADLPEDLTNISNIE